MFVGGEECPMPGDSSFKDGCQNPKEPTECNQLQGALIKRIVVDSVLAHVNSRL